MQAAVCYAGSAGKNECCCNICAKFHEKGDVLDTEMRLLHHAQAAVK